MKYTIAFFIISVCMLSCNQKKTQETTDQTSKKIEEISTQDYPEAIHNVFEAHGGIDNWRKQQTLSYILPKPGNPETHTIDLIKRFDKITSEDFDLGYDGSKPWVLAKDENYEGNVDFYHNLMFYFFAMPFVLADDGIIYTPTEPIKFEGIQYPGIKISFNDGVGTSSKDEYYVHYNSQTNQMEWLGYTVTYRTGETSDKVNWIRYNDWGTYNTLKLPNSISWYSVEDDKLIAVRNTVKFEAIQVSTEAMSKDFYKKPEGAIYFEKEN
ncbi:hypothetical protein GCM10011414_18400 [Croceivirga lutea]|uniref:DUF6503 family protein n=1 Tax=Croceivirga lutea TaxID=1775167 RepID=UPI0016399403|nr:DUF6503 family protein [Croceivirga lutea]GGG48931.1 hypothetical protein GCM10011414_18400 [Croceivirga lutea]